jgi:glutathione S-transferase
MSLPQEKLCPGERKLAITFYYGSGSPWAWRVWLQLEHKQLPYELKPVSFSARDNHKPEFLALNPRHKVPLIVDGDFSLYESATITEYLEDAYPAKPLWPEDAKQRALARRLTREADIYLGPNITRIGRQLFFKPEAERSAEEIASAREEVVAECKFFEQEMRGDFLAGEMSLADFALYPMVSLVKRMETKFMPSLEIDAALGPKLKAWFARMEALPYAEKCKPPHWKGA